MKLLVILLTVLIAITYPYISAEKSTYFDTVKFIQYLDESTALEEVRNGNLDVYYSKISSDRLEDHKARQGLQVYDSTGGSYSILVNPAKTDVFNPFSDTDIRFAINYLVDRKLIVNELMNGYGSAIISYYGPSDPEYLTVIEKLETFNFKYNPILANKIITAALEENGAIKVDGKWQINSQPIEIIMFIRNDDPVRKSIGEILAMQLEDIGFTVKKDFGDLNKAFVVVYGSNPADLKWHLYTEGWGRSAFVRYDATGLAQMYAPWFSNMPGFNDPSYWNYKNEKIDNVTTKIYTGDFETRDQRTQLVQKALDNGVNESVRVFLASTVDQYVVNERVKGVINDFGAGVPSRFTPINAQNGNDEFIVGVKQIYQGAWNPVMGFTDKYSGQIWDVISDPGVFKHPFTGKTIPVRTDFTVKTAGPNGKLEVPTESITWNPALQKWDNVPSDTRATSKVSFDLKFSNWHNGVKMDVNDILHAFYFTIEWGTKIDENDKTFDVEFTPRAAQSIKTIVGINQIDEDTFDVYVDYWHFDDGEIAIWAELYATTPWEIMAALEKAVIDGKMSFSRSDATNKNLNWASLLSPKDAKVIKEYLQEFKESKYIPQPLKDQNGSEYYQNRYDASIKWIETNNHAVISNGPYYLDSYSPESRTITVNAFDDESYPFKVGKWAEFESAELPIIKEAKIKKNIEQGSSMDIVIKSEHTDSIIYFLTDKTGQKIESNTLAVNNDITNFSLNDLRVGTNNIKVFAISETVLKPYFYESSFIVTAEKTELPASVKKDIVFLKNETMYELWIIPIIIGAIILIYIKKRRYNKP